MEKIISFSSVLYNMVTYYSLAGLISVDRYKFESVHSKKIVNAIVEGYREYIEHRRDRHEKMIISSAFAWTKGNFIESKIAEISGNLILSYRKAKAGLAWDKFSQAILPSKGSNGHRRTYLHELSKINQKLEFPFTQSRLLIS